MQSGLSITSPNALVNLPQPLTRLPGSSRAFVTDRLLERAEANAAGRVFSDQIFQLQQKRQEIAKQRRDLTSRSFPPPLIATDPKIAKLDADIAECVEAIERLRPRADRCSMIVANIDQLVKKLEEYMRGLKSEVRPGKPVAAPKLTKGESLDDAIETRRRRLRELAANVDRYRAAPRHSSVVLEAAIAAIDAQAKRGAPDADAAIETGGPVQWPTVSFKKFIPGFGKLEMEVADVMPILSHLLRGPMIEAVKAAIAAAADDDAALFDADRLKLITEAQRDALAVEREEVALVKAALTAGQPASFRPDTDPRALLDLADDLPAPQVRN